MESTLASGILLMTSPVMIVLDDFVQVAGTDTDVDFVTLNSSTCFLHSNSRLTHMDV